MDEVHKPGNSECYAPSSEPFRIYMALRNQFVSHLCNANARSVYIFTDTKSLWQHLIVLRNADNVFFQIDTLCFKWEKVGIFVIG
jgi:hypothetical protein